MSAKASQMHKNIKHDASNSKQTKYKTPKCTLSPNIDQHSCFKLQLALAKLHNSVTRQHAHITHRFPFLCRVDPWTGIHVKMNFIAIKINFTY